MSDEQSPGIDLGAAHLRPAQRSDPGPDGGPSSDTADRVPWEGSRRRGAAAALIATWWRVVRAPLVVGLPAALLILALLIAILLTGPEAASAG